MAGLTELVRLFKALGDENRLKIIKELHGNTYCVCDLADKIGIAQPTLSHHLKVLRETGLVHGEKQGPWMFCTLNKKTFDIRGLDLERLLDTSSPVKGAKD